MQRIKKKFDSPLTLERLRAFPPAPPPLPPPPQKKKLGIRGHGGRACAEENYWLSVLLTSSDSTRRMDEACGEFGGLRPYK